MTEDEAIAAFFAARLDEVEAAALYRRGGRPDLAAVVAGMDIKELASKLGDPDRALRQVEADRKLLAAWQQAEAHTPAAAWESDYTQGLRDAVRIRVSAWSDHPGYQEDWKP